MITVYTAKKIITMNPSWPEATAIAVRDGEILEVGDMAAMALWLQHYDSQINNDFADKVIMPGLIDPHLHPMMAAVLLPMQFITGLQWKFPWETVAATTSSEAYLAQLRLGHKNTAGDDAFFTWGYHSHWHGDMSRQLLDGVFGERPAVVWQRSFHEVYLNSAMIKHLGIEEEKVRGRPQIDIDKGHFYENGLGYAINKLNKIIMSPDWIAHGLERLKQVVHFGGQTTVGDMAVGIFDFDLEWYAAQNIVDKADSPYRVLCVPHGTRVSHKNGGHQQGLEFVKALPERNTQRLQFSNKIKLFTDGAFFSQLAMMQAPGYTDGHLGEWLMTPEEYETVARL